jgi:hypothetical protein
MTKTLTSKKILALVLALAMAFSVMAVSAYAASDGVGVPTNTQLWYADTSLFDQYTQTLDIKNNLGLIVSTEFDLGVNTIQRFVLDGSTYILATHPQYFALSKDYDDQANAQYIMEIRTILVLNPATGRYEECYADGFAEIPAAYALPSQANPSYFQCIIYSSILNVSTGEIFDADWNGAVVYLEIDTDN